VKAPRSKHDKNKPEIFEPVKIPLTTKQIVDKHMEFFFDEKDTFYLITTKIPVVIPKRLFGSKDEFMEFFTRDVIQELITHEEAQMEADEKKMVVQVPLPFEAFNKAHEGNPLAQHFAIACPLPNEGDSRLITKPTSFRPGMTRL